MKWIDNGLPMTVAFFCGQIAMVTSVAASECEPQFLCVRSAGGEQMYESVQGPASLSNTADRIEDQILSIQPVPSVFRLQARVSKAKLPLGEATFNVVIVKWKVGATTRCTETIADVGLRDSVLNLEVGRQCTGAEALDRLIAENSDVRAEICFQNETNCLTPITLGSVPYAIKSSYAARAAESALADHAARANYAHRVVADRSVDPAVGIAEGYFDFVTKNKAELPVAEGDAKFDHGGMIAWKPSRQTTPTLGISALDASGASKKLNTLTFYADNTVARGNTVIRGSLVSGPATFAAETDSATALAVSKGKAVMPEASITSKLRVKDVTITGTLQCVNASGAPVSCVDGSAVGFNYAASDSPGGAANVAKDVNCSGCVSGGEIAAGAVTGGPAGPIADGSVTTHDIKDGTISASDFAANAVVDSIADESISSQKIRRKSITASQLADNAVGTTAINDGAVTAQKLRLPLIGKLLGAKGNSVEESFAEGQVVFCSVGAISTYPNPGGPFFCGVQQENGIWIARASGWVDCAINCF